MISTIESDLLFSAADMSKRVIMIKLAFLSAALCSAACFIGVGSASADVYAFTFKADDLGGPYGDLVVTGEVTTSGALTSPVVSIEGEVSGAPSPLENGLISGLSSYADADNKLYATGANTNDNLSVAGLSFSVSGGQEYNLYTWNPGNGVGTYLLNSQIDSVGYTQNGAVGALTVTAVPELATWAMMLIGFAALGSVGYRKTRARQAAFAAA
jgi:hypothetical protein